MLFKKSFSRISLVALAAFVALGASACRDRDPLTPLVEKVAETTSRTGKALYSSVDFTVVDHYTVNERVCDKTQCGVDYRQVCDHERVCSPPTTSCTPGRNVCFGGGQVCNRDPRTGRRYCRYEPPRCQFQPGYCSTYPGVCRDVVVGCRTVEVPRYCDTNCRDIPVARTRERTVSSPVRVTVRGTSDLEDIKGVMIGFKANARFEQAMKDPALRPNGYEDLFENFAVEDKTLVILKAKGLELVPDQEFVNIPATFKPGDSIDLDLQVRPTGSRKTRYSTTGSTTDLPSFRFDTGTNGLVP